MREILNDLVKIGQTVAENWNGTMTGVTVTTNDEVEVRLVDENNEIFVVNIPFSAVKTTYGINIEAAVAAGEIAKVKPYQKPKERKQNTIKPKLKGEEKIMKAFEKGTRVVEMTVATAETEAASVKEFNVVDLKEFKNGRFVYVVPVDADTETKAVRRKIKVTEDGREYCGGVADKANVIFA